MRASRSRRSSRVNFHRKGLAVVPTSRCSTSARSVKSLGTRPCVAPPRKRPRFGPARRRAPAYASSPRSEPAGQPINRGLAAVGGSVVHHPEHSLRRSIRLTGHHLLDQRHERHDPRGGRSGADDPRLVHVIGGQIGRRAAPPVLVVDPHHPRLPRRQARGGSGSGPGWRSSHHRRSHTLVGPASCPALPFRVPRGSPEEALDCACRPYLDNPA